MAFLRNGNDSGLFRFTSSRCKLLAILLGNSQVRSSAAAVHYRVEGRDAIQDAAHHSSMDHASMSFIRREVDSKKISRSNAAEGDGAQMIDARAPIQATNRGAWWFWPEPEPQPALVPAPMPAPEPVPKIEKSVSAPPWKPFVDKRHIDETATLGETLFFESLEAEIKNTWFLHGQSLVIMIASRPYLVSPNRNAPVTLPHALENQLGLGVDSANPESVARRAYAKSLAELVMWVPDVTALTTLVRDCSTETMMSLQQERKLRGFWKGEEHSSRHVDKMSSADFVKLGLSTMWLRGGLGRESPMKKAIISSPLIAAG